MDTNPLHRCSFQWTGIDTIGMDTNPFVAGVVDAAVDVITRYDRRSRQAGGRATRLRGQFCGPPGQASDAINARLRTSVRRAIITVIAQLLPAAIT